MCAYHTHLLSKHTHSQFSQWLSTTEQWELDSSKDSLALAQFINKDVAVYEYAHLNSSEWQKFCGGGSQSSKLSNPKPGLCRTISMMFLEHLRTM